MTTERGKFTPFENTDRYYGDFGHHDDRRPENDQGDDGEEFGRYKFDRDISGEAYAWGKMAYSIYRSHSIEAYRNVRGHSLAVDLCSSFPLNSQILRDHYREGIFPIARGIITNLINELGSNYQGNRAIYPPALSKEPKQKLISELTASFSPIRRFLTVATLDLLCESLVTDKNKDNADKIITQMDYILKKFYHHAWNGERLISLDFYIKMGMERLYGQNQERTLDKLIRSTTGIEDPLPLLNRLALYIAAACTLIPRRFTVLSLDNEVPDKLRRGSQKGFPELFQTINFVFNRAWDNMHKYHLQADIFNLPFSKNSLSFITSVEGYPFYFPGLPLEDKNQKPNHLAFAQSVIDVLKPGGRAVFFPWHTKRQTRQDAENLKEVERFWKEKGMNVRKERHNRFKLLMEMGEREKDLAEHSPLFTGDPHRMNYTALVLIKPTDFSSSQEEGESRGRDGAL